MKITLIIFSVSVLSPFTGFIKPVCYNCAPVPKSSNYTESYSIHLFQYHLMSQQGAHYTLGILETTETEVNLPLIFYVFCFLSFVFGSHGMVSVSVWYHFICANCEVFSHINKWLRFSELAWELNVFIFKLLYNLRRIFQYHIHFFRTFHTPLCKIIQFGTVLCKKYSTAFKHWKCTVSPPKVLEQEGQFFCYTYAEDTGFVIKRWMRQ